MNWKIRYTASAARTIRKRDPEIRRRVKFVETLALEPERGKPLQLTLKGLRSWRTADYRIIYRFVEDQIEILVDALGHRREVYERLRRRLKSE